MGGCYNTSYSYSSDGGYCNDKLSDWQTRMNASVNKFFHKNDIADLVKAYTAFSEAKNAGFVKLLLDYQKCAEAPKEFPEIEYEVKFSIVPVSVQSKKSGEPNIKEYLDAFEFPASGTARFLKDSVNTIAEGTNHFYGKDNEERLVVIEKGGKLFLKEKSQPLLLNTDVQYERLVMKRTEKRYQVTMEEILKKVSDTTADGAVYHGNIRKEKGDAFILDTHDGRIFSFTITRAHLRGTVQRQLEIEYAGYVPNFPDFQKDNESQIVSDMVDIAKRVVFLSNNAPVGNGWRMQLGLTNERKYDFVRGKALDVAAQVFLPLLDTTVGEKCKK
ncbi:MAG: hypothetical protein HY363_03485 [Candidatus Aenigmarchaeota archaeon]|nr:hypothetical protein [Candidatus Aenigmarchaeota archaeon]